MAQHDYIIANQSGAAFRSDLNNGLAAIVSNNSGAAEPSTTYAYQWWADTTTGLLKIRNAANNAWITIGTLASVNLGLLPREGGTLNGNLTIINQGSTSAVEIGTGTTTSQAAHLDFVGDTTYNDYGFRLIRGNAGANSESQIRHKGSGAFSIITEEAGPVAILTNGVERVEFGTTEVVFNDGGADFDFRVEGDTKANLLLVDAGADTVSIDGTQQLANQTPLRFGDSDNSHYVALRSPATVTTNVTWDLPATDGTVDQVLKTNGSGVLGWSSGGVFASTSEVSGTHTTGTVTSGSASLTVASATGIVAGMFIVGEGIAPGTTVSSIASTTVTMSANAGATLSSDPVAFYIADKSLSPGLVAGQLCRAWVNFDGTGTVAIRASYNVSSITDNATGDYTVNFTTAMVDANYAAVISGNSSTSLDPPTTATPIIYGQYGTKTTSAQRIISLYGPGSAAFDTAVINVAIFR
jgi:hypothetical protein